MIRELDKNDYLLYKEIRLELLENHPRNFGSSKEDEEKFEDHVWIERLNKEMVYTIGYFKDEFLLGISVLVCSPRQKMKHVASIHSVYVRPNFRGYSIGKKLLEYTQLFAQTKGIKRLNLSVMSTNKEAIGLYEKLGFVFTGKELEMIHYNDEFYDLDLYTKKL